MSLSKHEKKTRAADKSVALRHKRIQKSLAAIFPLSVTFPASGSTAPGKRSACACIRDYGKSRGKQRYTLGLDALTGEAVFRTEEGLKTMRGLRRHLETAHALLGDLLAGRVRIVYLDCEPAARGLPAVYVER